LYHPHGVYPAIPTPFKKNGELDDTGLRDLVSYYGSTGVNGVLALGTIGEFAMMTERERKRAADVIVGAANKLEVIVNAGYQTINMARYLKDLGVDAIIAVEPYFYHPSPDGMARHYLEIAEAVDMPVIAYNIPQFAGNSLKPEFLETLSKEERIVGLKDSEGDSIKLQRFIDLAPEEFSVMVGWDGLVSYGICMGASGMMVGSASVAPDICVRMYRAIIEKYLDRAFVAQRELNHYIQAMQVGTFPASVKYMLSLQGHPGGHVRKPLEDLSPEQKRLVDIQLRAAGALKELVV
jgi:4-hydroxy-tetrahydrodipicolinate synthase